MGIKKVVQAWNSVSLVKRIVIGLVIGGVLGVAVPNIEVVELLGTLFAVSYTHLTLPTKA